MPSERSHYMHDTHSTAVFFAAWQQLLNGNNAAADRLFREASDDIPNAKIALAVNYLLGLDTRKNRPRARALLAEAASEGCVSALFCLGDVYLNGEGVEPDTARALRYWRAAATAQVLSKRRSAEACRDGVELIAFLEDEAARMAAENLAVLYETGSHGVRKNSARAKRWNERAQAGKPAPRARKKSTVAPPIDSPALPDPYVDWARSAEARDDFESAARFYMHAIAVDDDAEARRCYLILRDAGKLEPTIRAWQARRASGQIEAARALAMMQDLDLLPVPPVVTDDE